MRLWFAVVVLLTNDCIVSSDENGPDWKHEFVAGSFILTQKSLNEAPYRYAGVLRQVLDKVETKDPPSQSDEENCDAKYRIEPSGTSMSLSSGLQFQNFFAFVIFRAPIFAEDCRRFFGLHAGGQQHFCHSC